MPAKMDPATYLVENLTVYVGEIPDDGDSEERLRGRPLCRRGPLKDPSLTRFKYLVKQISPID